MTENLTETSWRSRQYFFLQMCKVTRINDEKTLKFTLGVLLHLDGKKRFLLIAISFKK